MVTTLHEINMEPDQLAGLSWIDAFVLNVFLFQGCHFQVTCWFFWDGNKERAWERWQKTSKSPRELNKHHLQSFPTSWKVSWNFHSKCFVGSHCSHLGNDLTILHSGKPTSPWKKHHFDGIFFKRDNHEILARLYRLVSHNLVHVFKDYCKFVFVAFFYDYSPLNHHSFIYLFRLSSANPSHT